jgi:hypothetical protein
LVSLFSYGEDYGSKTPSFYRVAAGVADPDPNQDLDPPDPHVFWASWIRIRSLLSLSKNGKKNLDFYCFVTSF